MRVPLLIWVLVDMRHGMWLVYCTSICMYKSLMMHIIKFKFRGQIVLEKDDWRPDITGAYVQCPCP